MAEGAFWIHRLCERQGKRREASCALRGVKAKNRSALLNGVLQHDKIITIEWSVSVQKVCVCIWERDHLCVHLRFRFIRRFLRWAARDRAGLLVSQGCVCSKESPDIIYWWLFGECVLCSWTDMIVVAFNLTVWSLPVITRIHLNTAFRQWGARVGQQQSEKRKSREKERR